MQWTLRHFYHAARAALARYQTEHTWFTWRDRDPESHIFDAWRLYKRANENALGFLLLGDAKIRTNRDLLMNFGVTSGNGLSDERDLQQIRELAQQRRGLAGPRSGPARDVLGPGSILNDQGWTPLLNDAFILGGVHGGQDFHWAEEGFHQFTLIGERDFLTRRDAFGAAAPQYAAALKRDGAYYKERWQHYLLGRSNFWLGGLVRVFARELIGLKAFGYSPVFTGQALSFASDGGSAGTFEEYLNALAAVNYFRNDAASINAALGEFLFGDPLALTNLGTGASPRPPGQQLLKPSAGPKPRDWPR